MRSISRIKKQMKRFNRIAEHNYEKKNYKEYAQNKAYYALLEWILGKDNEWEIRLITPSPLFEKKTKEEVTK